MRNGFSFIFLLLYLFAIIVNWRQLKAGSDKFLFVGLAVIVFGLYMAYNLKIEAMFSPATAASRMIDRLFMGFNEE